jgi:hypothetical protein
MSDVPFPLCIALSAALKADRFNRENVDIEEKEEVTQISEDDIDEIQPEMR